jgi:hypothetical protein
LRLKKTKQNQFIRFTGLDEKMRGIMRNIVNQTFPIVYQILEQLQNVDHFQATVVIVQVLKYFSRCSRVSKLRI